MAQLTKGYDTHERPGWVVAYRMGPVKIWKGGLVGVDATGYLRPMNPAIDSMRFMGVANETVDNSEGQPGDRIVNVTKTGSFVLKAAWGYVPVLTELGCEAYAASDWEASSSPERLPNAYKIGTIVAIETTATGTEGVRVRIDNHSV